MNVKYLKKGSVDCPLICLFDFTKHEISELINLVQDLASDNIQCVELTKSFNLSKNYDFTFLLEVGSKDLGVLEQDNIFKCILTSLSWNNVIGLMEPFLQESTGFQWLSETGNISLLLSKDGQW